MSLKEQYLEALKTQQKQEVSKSAISATPLTPGKVGPKKYVIKRGGQVLGYAEGETLSPAEIEALKSEVAKSATLEPEPDNSIFDDLFEFGAGEPEAVEVQKSANETDSILASIFPRWLQPNFPNQ